MKYLTHDKLKKSLSIIIILTLYLGLLIFFTAYASTKDAVHRINLNDGEPVIEELSATFMPGDTIKRKFFIENEGSTKLDYRLYFDGVEGSLKDILEFTIKSGEDTLMTGKMKDYIKRKNLRKTGTLEPKERDYLTIEFHFPKDADSSYETSSIEFDLKAIGIWSSK